MVCAFWHSPKLRVKLGCLLQTTETLCEVSSLYIPHQGCAFCLWHCSAEHHQPTAGLGNTEGINMSTLFVLGSLKVLGWGKIGFSFSTSVVHILIHSCVCVYLHTSPVCLKFDCLKASHDTSALHLKKGPAPQRPFADMTTLQQLSIPLVN